MPIHPPHVVCIDTFKCTSCKSGLHPEVHSETQLHTYTLFPLLQQHPDYINTITHSHLQLPSTT